MSTPEEVSLAHSLTEEQAARLAQVVLDQKIKAKAEYAKYRPEGGIEEVANRFWEQVKPTARSGTRAVRPSKPKDGRAAYVWRMLRFHTGEDVHMPVTADFDMHRDMEREMGIDWHLMTDEQKRALYAREETERKRLDAVVDYILATRFPLRQFRGALRWEGLLY